MSPDPQALLAEIQRLAASLGEVRLMEVCGTHTVALFRTGVKGQLPANVQLLSGPGCPVCVTSQGYLDAACAAASLPGVTVCTYGDMVRVPGRHGSLAEQRARGASVRVVYSARDALAHALAHPETQVVFLGVGFETTAPITALVVREAAARGVANFTVFPCHKLVIPALQTLLADPTSRLDGFLCPGHVSVIIGADPFRPIARDFRKPCVIAGFETSQLLLGVRGLLRQLAEGASEVDNVYGVAVRPQGNPIARECVEEVFEVADSAWRALGTLPASGLALRQKYRAFDAVQRHHLEVGPDYEAPGCRCGDVIQGKLAPAQCPLFGRPCTPAKPIGPCMVSSEGTCAAWYKYGGLKRET